MHTSVPKLNQTELGNFTIRYLTKVLHISARAERREHFRHVTNNLSAQYDVYLLISLFASVNWHT